MDIKKPIRQFLPQDFELSTWEKLKPYFELLVKKEINSKKELMQWFVDKSELEAVLSENLAWRYIKMTCDTSDKGLTKSYEEFVTQIQPHISPYDDLLNRKAIESPYLTALEKEEGFAVMIRSIKMNIEIFREENIPLEAVLATESQKYGAITGGMSVEFDGEEITLQQASIKLKDNDRKVREKAYHKIAERRHQDSIKLDDLFSELITLRHQVALNAGFDNYRDYMFKAMGRFDYTPQDCFDFHDAIEHEVMPLMAKFLEERKEKLGLEKMRPWDTLVDVEGNRPLKPFSNAKELTEKTVKAFNKIDPYFGDCIDTMDKMGHLDLDSRKGKSPGGYNYPLSEIGVPFIFMNATSQQRDLTTMIHEGGHAIHSFLTRDLLLSDFKDTPAEVAELASMSMELISMDQWDLFFDDKEELRRAKKEQLEGVLETLPWVAIIDKFQHWLYENPKHSQEERTIAWNNIFDRFSTGIVNWDGLEKFKNYAWQKQLHLYEVPFYYIEYAMAQLGAIAMYKSYKENKVKGLEGYKQALELGYTKPIADIYKAGGIKFDFSRPYIADLVKFIKDELNNL